MKKREDSLRSLGMTMAAMDKGTKSRFQVAAEREGITLAEYLRDLANRETEGGMQTTFKPISPTERINQSLQAHSQVINFLAFALIGANPAAYIEEFKRPGSIMNDLLPEARNQLEELAKLARERLDTGLKKAQQAKMPEFNGMEKAIQT